MNELDLIDDFDLEFGVNAEKQRDRRVWVTVDREALMDVGRFLFDKGFEHLSAISVTEYMSSHTTSGVTRITFWLL